MEKIVDIIELIACEKGLKVENVTEAVQRALIATAKKVHNENYTYGANLDTETKKISLYRKIVIVENDDKRLENDPQGFMSLSEAYKLNKDFEVGDEAHDDIELEEMGHTGVNILFKELEFHIQHLVEIQLFEKYQSQIGRIVTGTVVRIDDKENTFVDIEGVRALLPMKNRIKGEKFQMGSIVKAILKFVSIDRKNGIAIELSRTTPKFLEELLKLEVPEIHDSEVIIHKCARIPGERSKVAISSNSPKIDPIGATVGVKGVRINAVSKELKNENIDCIEFSEIGEKFVARSLAPALISSVRIEESKDSEQKKAIVMLPGEQKSKAIGKNGINIRLATMLTGYEIELIEQNNILVPQQSNATEEKADISTLASLFKQ
ncbi:transcription termination/antitermination protein NusA [Helicobacter monodelphidis]|uniref:transcription termination factor NusA n=1 Tax=Helicobacter sp. 15-1451 TaxID=2004995 RepID=UPI000DCEBBE3|nr:transcription termination factor NusA [Helicobacter sp. 15-1451]RAX58419.1 transcription termination/antitermination protein NusA [Helicobacter sp. 15-1451]